MDNDSPRRRFLGAARLAVILAVGAGLFSSCDAADEDAPELERLAGRVPDVAVMLELARERPATTLKGATRVESLHRPALAGGTGWKESAKEVSIEVDDATGRMAIRTGRNVHIAATRLGGRSVHAATEGPALLLRDAAGNAESALLARPYGVEELFFQQQPDATVGYELELPVGWSLRQPRGFAGLVEILDRRARPRLRLIAKAAWDDEGVSYPVLAELDGSRVLFRVPGASGRRLVVDPEWQDTGSPAHVRARSTATLLQDGRLLVIGGLAGTDEVLADEYEVLCSTEIYDPLEQTWEAGPPVQGPDDATCTGLMDHVAVPLQDGTVLIAGGANRDAKRGADQPAALDRAWRYDPVARTFTPTGAMSEARVHHTATLLQSGKVLITGGGDRLTPLQEAGQLCPKVGDERCQRCVGQASAELYDPATGVFSPLDMPTPRACHTATLLGDDSVLLIGGGGDPVEVGDNGATGRPLDTMTLYRDGTFTDLPTRLNTPRFGHVAVHRPDRDEVLVAFGRDTKALVGPPRTDAPTIAEVLDLGAVLSTDAPALARPVACGPLPAPGGSTTSSSTAASGAGGGEGGIGGSGIGGDGIGGDDAVTTGGQGGSGEGGGGPDERPECPLPRAYSSAVLTREGRVLIVGGQAGNGTAATAFVDGFDFDAQAFLDPPPPQLLSPVSKPVLSVLPTGAILLVGLTAPAELLDDTVWTFSDAAGASLAQPRGHHTVTRLPDGTLLVAGGASESSGSDGGVRDTAEIFDPEAMSSSPTPGPMTIRRLAHTATLLPATAEHGPRVLLVGGLETWLALAAEDVHATNTAEIYDPETRTFTPTGSMATERAFHTAVRLATGQVLVTGGVGDRFDANAPSAELYDPSTGTFVALAAPMSQRIGATSTLLPSGDVLLTGGFLEWGFAQSAPLGELAAAEIFDHQSATFRTIAGMIAPRGYHAASPLGGGLVLITGGSAVSRLAEAFDAETETFRAIDGIMTAPRIGHAAVTLPSGKVLIAGGSQRLDGFPPRSDVEIFDPVSEQFELVAAPATPAQARWNFEAALLADGRVALVGGHVDGRVLEVTADITLLSSNGSEVGAGADLLSGPVVALPGGSYEVRGLGLSSFWEASSGPYVSPTGAPIAIWVPDAGAPVLGTFSPWSQESSTWTPPSTPFAGNGLLFASRHGQTSAGLPLAVSRAPNGITCSADAACESGFCSDGVCCDQRCHVPGDPDSICRACSVERGAPADGTCSVSAEDTDPHEDCTQAAQCAEKFAVCGGDGTCKACLCASRQDCAEGYVCTAEGGCEPPATELVVEGCTVAAVPGGTGRAPLVPLLLAGAAALAWSARRARRAYPGQRSYKGASCENSHMTPQTCLRHPSASACVTSNGLRVSDCVVRSSADR